MHIAVQDKTESEGGLVTCVRVWDPQSKEHIALCRRCSQQHVNNLSRQLPQSSASTHYAPPLYRPQRPPLSAKPQWWHRVLAWYKRPLTLLVCLWWRQRQARTQTASKRYTDLPSKH
jgi:hypothetical protein